MTKKCALEVLNLIQKEIFKYGGRELCKSIAYGDKPVLLLNDECETISEPEKEDFISECRCLTELEEILIRKSAREIAKEITDFKLIEIVERTDNFVNDLAEITGKEQSIILQETERLCTLFADNKEVRKILKAHKDYIKAFFPKKAKYPKDNIMTKEEIKKKQSENVSNIGLQLKKWRESKGYNLYYVASALGTYNVVIQKIEEGNVHTEFGIAFAYMKMANLVN